MTLKQKNHNGAAQRWNGFGTLLSPVAVAAHSLLAVVFYPYGPTVKINVVKSLSKYVIILYIRTNVTFVDF